MATDPETISASTAGVEATDHQPSSPASASSREDTRDARERLKKTSIAGMQNSASQLPSNSTSSLDTAADISDLRPESANANGARGRPSKKRSYEDLSKDNTDADKANDDLPDPKRTDHKRVRSVEVGHDQNQPSYTRHEGDKSKTVQEESDIDAQTAPGGPGIFIEAPSQEEMSSTPGIDTQNATNNKAGSTGETATGSKISASSGFANTSSASPFGQSKSPVKSTSTSAFSASGLSAFASSESSPFGAAPLTKSSFGGGGTFGGGSSAGSGFGRTSGFASNTASSFAGPSSNTFGASKSFGSSSAFGTPKPFGSSSGFGGGAAPSSFGSGKPIGAVAKDDADDEQENSEDEDATSNTNEDDEQDPRFHEQQVDTGEGGEDTLFTARARLYFFEGAWKERGTGVVKINIRMTDDESEDRDLEAPARSRRRARLLMRADATHRVILNSPIFKGMRFGDSDGAKPSGKIMHLQSLENGKPIPLQIKIGKEDVLLELYDHLRDLEQEA